MKILVIGGTGLIGSKVVEKLKQKGHEAIAATPNTGVNTITGDGLKEAMAGAQVVIDLANSPSFEDTAVLSNGTGGRPQRCRDFQRQYNLKPARCQRITVSGFTIASALMVSGTKRYSPTKITRFMAPKASLFGWWRRWMLI
jgi:hypothetical protein